MQAHWRRTRGMTLGVQGCAMTTEGKVCLVRHTYRPGWHFPGGGVERGETLSAALTKEMREEAGLALTAAPRLVSVYSNEAKFRGDHIALYLIRDWTACEPDHRDEIAEVIWTPADDLPPETSPATRRRLAEILGGTPPADSW